MVRLALACAAWLALAAAAHAGEPTGSRAGEPGCRAEPVVLPARAVAGQQVLYRVRVWRRDDVVRVEWAEPPAFAHARAEVLPPEPRPDEREQGVLYHVHDELRALFAERSGRLTLGGAVLRCAFAGGAVQDLRVGARELDVLPFPEAGRPAEFDGVVGPLWLHLVVTPERVALGESVRVALMARGAGNLWLLDAPLEAAALPGSDVFARAPELALERGRGLFVRRHFAYDIVPRAAGRLVIPPLQVAYFDPEAGAYRQAATEEVQVRVEERAAAAAATRAPADAGAARPRTQGSSRAVVAALAAACALGGAAVWWRLRRRADDTAARALAEAGRSRAAGDRTGELAAQSRALRAALARDVPDALALDAEELAARAARPAARDAAALLASLERARFQPGAAAPAAEEVERAVRALAGGRGLGPAASVLLLLALGGCASDPATRDAPMTPARLEAELREKAADLENVDGHLRFTFGGVRMVCLYDIHVDRVRIMAAVAEESALTVASARILLQANFATTFDARYGLHDGMLYAVFLHPLSTLDSRELEAVLPQLARLVRNYGTTYSAGGK
jgi:hypothetical protein